MSNDPNFSNLLHTRRMAAVLTEMGALLRSTANQHPAQALEILDLLDDDLEECRRILRPSPPRNPHRLGDPDSLLF